MQKRNIRCMKICEKKYIDRNRYLRAGRSKFNVETPKKKVLWNQILVYFKTFRLFAEIQFVYYAPTERRQIIIIKRFH